jgi:hypothetical protein
MPLLKGTIEPGGAIIDVLVGVSKPRRRLLEKHGFPVPYPVHVRALIDTGAHMSGFAPRVFKELSVLPVTKTAIYTPSTPPGSPHECDLYDVSLSLVANGSPHPFPDSRVMEADCWMPGEGIEALIGTDILNKCYLRYHGLDMKFDLSF